MSDHQDDLRSRYASERAQLKPDIAERARQIERERVVAEAEARNAERTVTKGYAPPRDYGRQRSEPPADMVAAGWVRYIADQIGEAERAAHRHIADQIRKSEHNTHCGVTRGIGETIARDIVAAEKRIAQLESEVAELRALLEQGQHQRQRGPRVVPSSEPGAMIA